MKLENQGWRGVDYCALLGTASAGAMVKSKPELPLRATARSEAISQQGLVVSMSITYILPLEDMGMSLVRAATSNHLDAQVLFKIDLVSHWLQHLGKMAYIPCAGSTVELVLVAGM